MLDLAKPQKSNYKFECTFKCSRADIREVRPAGPQYQTEETPSVELEAKG